MTMVGPRVYAAMAREGVLPRALAGERGRPPMISVILQSTISLALLFTHTFEQLLHNVGAILTLTSALTTLCLFRLQFGNGKWAKPGPVALAAATVFVALSAWMLYFAFRGSPRTIAWVVAVAACAIVAWFATVRARRPG
jgi:APA family basic amino acid/polyamine antiporter